MRAEPSTRVLATDATPARGGAVVCSVSPELAGALYRVAECRGVGARLDGANAEAETRLLQRSDITDQLVRSLGWTETTNYSFKCVARINLQEARALRRETKRECIRSGEVRRLLVFCDSMVCVGAFSKGRSSSFKLNGIIRATLGHLMLEGMELALIWVSTGCNPADFPSRNHPHSPTRPYTPQLRTFGWWVGWLDSGFGAGAFRWKGDFDQGVLRGWAGNGGALGHLQWFGI